MATHKSADKAHRQSLRRQSTNRANVSKLRTEIKRLREVAGTDRAAALKLLPGTLSLIDKSIQKRILHGNAAARYKSRLTRLVQAAKN
ncbi:MAG TPA: 30S ribosomal protein S20 [Verrucomicrobiae bacterium]|nr:30S ribosomal protein S20 [Verrucomicrobiae bacterium]